MSEAQIGRALRKIHEANPGSSAEALGARMTEVSSRFIGTPYKLNPLGEGPAGEFDRKPLYSFAAADCTTFIEEAMALSLEPDLKKALSLLQKIRYRGGKISYFARNHFPEADWIANNIKAGFLADVTRKIAGDKTRVAGKLIVKGSWYAAKTEKDLHGFNRESPDELSRRLSRLRALGKDAPDAEVELPYLPTGDLPALIGKIPTGTIASLFRADDPEASAHAQPTMVTHQALIVVKDGRSYVRHAAYGKSVEDVAALDYFKRYEGSKRKLLGINLLRLRKPGGT